MISHDKGCSSSRLGALALVAMILLFASTSVVLGQERSKDRDNPTLLTANELSDDLDGSNDEYFYKFCAGPGNVTVTFEVKASGTNAGAHLDLFDTNARSILTDVLAQGVDSGTERVVKSIQLGRLRDIVMRIKGIQYGDNGGNGYYKVRLEGLVSCTKADAPKAMPAPSPDAPKAMPSPSPDAPKAMASPSPDAPQAMPSPSPDAPKAMPASFAGCWAFAGKGSFARASLGCFTQEGDRVSFETSEFEGTVIGNTLRFALKAGLTNTALAYRSGHFEMDAGGKSFTGSVNSSLNPDDNTYPVTATYDRPAAKANKDL